MEREKIEALLPDYLDGTLDNETRAGLEKSIKAYPDLVKELEDLAVLDAGLRSFKETSPSDSSKMRFRQALSEEKAKGSNQPQSGSTWIYQVAAGFALLVCGLSVGMLISQKPIDEAQLASLQQELQETKQLVLQSTLRDHSASERIRAVNLTESISEVDVEMMRTLIRTLNTDESPNVRLAAAEALRRFSNIDFVKAALVKSLSQQTDPILQITLIQMMVDLQEKSAIKVLRDLRSNENTLEVVRKNAATGIQLLI